MINAHAKHDNVTGIDLNEAYRRCAYRRTREKIYIHGNFRRRFIKCLYTYKINR